MIDSEQRRATYADRKSRGVCVRCEAPSGEFAQCEDCRARNKVYSSNYQKRNPKLYADWMRRAYQQDPEKFRQRQRDRRLAKKLKGECGVCSEPAADGSNYCVGHTESERARKRKEPTRASVRQPAPPRSVPCDCGEPRAPGLDCCARCAHLDGIGRRDRAADVIEALRGSDGMSLRELCRVLGMDDSLGNGTRSMWRWVKRLMDEGRIRRYWHEDSTASTEHVESFRNGDGEKRGAVGCWAYCLDGKTEREWRKSA